MSAEARSKHASNIPSQRLLSEDAERVIAALGKKVATLSQKVDELRGKLQHAKAAARQPSRTDNGAGRVGWGSALSLIHI